MTIAVLFYYTRDECDGRAFPVELGFDRAAGERDQLQGAERESVVGLI